MSSLSTSKRIVKMKLLIEEWECVYIHMKVNTLKKKNDILLPKLKISHVKFKVYPKNIKYKMVN